MHGVPEGGLCGEPGPVGGGGGGGGEGGLLRGEEAGRRNVGAGGGEGGLGELSTGAAAAAGPEGGCAGAEVHGGVRLEI